MYKYILYFKYKGIDYLPWNMEILTDKNISLKLIPNNGGFSFDTVWVNTSEILMIKKIEIKEV